MRQTIFFAFLLIATCSLSAQTLPRKGSLGVMIGNLDDSGGVLVQQVIAGSTGERLGLQAGDIIVSIDGEPYATTQEVVALTQTWRAKQKLKVIVERDEKQVKLKGRVVGKPTESSTYGEVIYGSVPFEEGLLRSILTLPKEVENPPVVLFVPGYGCGSLDYYYDDQAPIKQFVEGLVEQGIAVYRVEKPGMGDSNTNTQCATMGYEKEIAAYQAALAHLKQQKNVDTNKIILYGHSLGGITAPVIASKDPVYGIICWGSVATSWYEYTLRILRDRPVQRGEDYAETEANYRARQPLLHDFLNKKMTPSQLMENPDYKKLIEEGAYGITASQFLGMHYTYSQEINEVSLPDAWKNTNCPVLALHGQFDFHAIDSEWAQRTAEIVNFYNPNYGSYKIIPETEHGFALVSSMEKNIELLDAGAMDSQYRGNHYNPAVVETIVAWIKELERA